MACQSLRGREGWRDGITHLAVLILPGVKGAANGRLALKELDVNGLGAEEEV